MIANGTDVDVRRMTEFLRHPLNSHIESVFKSVGESKGSYYAKEY